jgi:flagellin-like hook-associated protein FlgL
MADVNLSKAVRQNLLSLQSTANSMAKTQNRLATGLKVNSALDNPSNFFTAQSLNSRASDMANLMDSMSSGIKTIEAADNGLTSITKTVESMQSTLRQARQDKSFKTGSFSVDTTAVAAGVTTNATAKTISVSDGSVGTTPVKFDVATAQGTTTGGSAATAMTFDEAGDSLSFNLASNGGSSTAVKIEKGSTSGLKITVGGTATDNIGSTNSGVTGDQLATALQTAFSAVGSEFSVSSASNKLTFTGKAADASTASVTLSGAAVTNGSTNPLTAAGADLGMGSAVAGVSNVTAKSVDAIVSSINSSSALTDKVRASNDGGKLRLENQSTSDLTVTGVGSAGTVDGSSSTSSIGGNDVRKNLAKQFNDLRDQLDKFADDASFNGINLLRGDKLKLTFNETGTSTIEIQAKKEDGTATSINNTALGIDAAQASDFDSDAKIDSKLDTLKGALDGLRSQSSTFGSNLSVVENRQDFTKNMINTLQTGAANLTLADTNEEAANLLALQTRQQLSSSALSMASQADQAVLRLF